MANRLVLAIDNTIDYLTLALASGQGFIEERQIKETRAPSQIIPESVRSILGDRDLSVGDLTGIIVTLGPGSFTGIRVALAFCKGLNAATGVPVTGIPTLDALAFALADREGSYLCPLIDAKKGEVFSSLYHVSRGALKRLTSYGALKPEDVPKTVRTPCVLFGTGTAACEKYLSGMSDVTILHAEHDHISGKALVDERLAAMSSDRRGSLMPIYGRRSEAEIKLNINID
ncbi:MAG TPA: tRNA (adenosine(37)-N6)-threonylcarbamoyltransferase complex dimerization subunit type 1 TsaB [Syntrophorhabdaceae bacterium]|nr:tRNA (adenosine(37)-N6)-threonylcarbamoyltransferase complex dimerization subunit type 1 TsaB [Syntrophorhabdaceae bacterium]